MIDRPNVEGDERTVHDLSVVVAISHPHRLYPVGRLFEDYRSEIEKVGLSYEFLFVVEGDDPKTFNELTRIKKKGDSLQILQLSQRYGDATALLAGLQHASGRIIMTLPDYPQVTAGSLGSLISQLDGCDLVVVRRWPRVDSLLNRWQNRAFHFILRRMFGVSLHDLGCGVRVFRREVIERVHVYGYKHWFLPILADRIGLKVKEIEVSQAQEGATQRYYRLSVYSRRLLDLLSVFFLVKFTRKPIRFFGITGLAIFGVGAIWTLYLAIQRMFMGIPLADRPVLLLALLLIVLGVQLFAIGLIGELIIFTSSRDLKDYTIERIVN